MTTHPETVYYKRYLYKLACAYVNNYSNQSAHPQSDQSFDFLPKEGLDPWAQALGMLADLKFFDGCTCQLMNIIY